MEIKIDRRTKIGFGYNTTPANDGTTRICPCEGPDYTGTIKTIFSKIKSDKVYQSLKNSTHMSIGYFVKHNGQWIRVSRDSIEYAWSYLIDFPIEYRTDTFDVSCYNTL